MPKQLILLGYEQTKRTDYMLLAAKKLKTDLQFISFPPDHRWELFDAGLLQNSITKIDAIDYQTADIARIPDLAQGYLNFLDSLKDVAGIQFLNSVESLKNTMCKMTCKQILTAHQIPVTPVINGGEFVCSYENLRDLMDDRRVYRVFIKPRYGSGAAGVTAFQIQPGTKKMALYSSARFQDGRIYNTKRITCHRDSEMISMIVNALLQQNVVIEKWLPKDSFQGMSYDLRVVWQFGQADFMVARRARTPITNLHLNNQALPFECLGLSQKVQDRIGQICRQAVSCFDGLNMAGIDILLTPGNQEPYIIEMNGQGDLIYQDIYHDNKIYQRQMIELEKMRK